MAKVLGPDFISLQVRDLSAARSFYTELLGLTIDPRFDMPDFVLFNTNSIPLALSEAKVPLDAAPNGGITLWLDCDDADALHERLAAAGVVILTPPYDGPFGRAFVFADRDGYRITTNQNPWDQFPLGGQPRSP